MDLEDGKSLEPGELLDECWFFGRNKKTTHSRSLSDSFTLSDEKIYPGRSYEETYESIKKKQTKVPPSTLGRTTRGSTDSLRSKSNRKTKTNGLNRAPSLPVYLETEEEFEDEDSEFSMGKLIRQASLESSDKFLTRVHAAKGVTQSRSLSREGSMRKPEVESLKLEDLEETRFKSVRNRLKTQRSMSDICELQGLKDGGFDFEKNDVNPIAISTIHGSLEKKRSMEDMKEQIKFWARVVASNVH